MSSTPFPHAETPEAAVERLGSDAARGLSDEEATARLTRGGPNELPRPASKGSLEQLAGQFSNPIVLTLLAAAAIAIVNGAGPAREHEPWLVRYGDATAILLIVVLNAFLGFVQERRAEAALAALEKMQTPNARVLRGSEVRLVAATRVVAGDVLELEAGDAVPADARLLQTVELSVEESTLTGESLPVHKDARAAVDGDAPLADRPTMLFVGTSVVRGKGRAIVTATGADTELGKLSMLIRRERDRTTPLEQKLQGFGKRVLWGCLGLSALLFVRGWLHGGRTWNDLLLEAVSLAVAAIPEGLPAITTITLALGMQRMAKRGAIVRKLAAVETLGAATVICTDKTGTLTQNEMTVREVYAGGVRYRVTGAGYDPTGAILDTIDQRVEPSPGSLCNLLTTAALCNDARLEVHEGRWRVQGDPTEGALLALAEKGGTTRHALAASHTIVRELPFDSNRRRMTVVTLDANATRAAHCKGSPDVLLPLCSEYETANGVAVFTETARQRILAEAEEMSGRALRVLAFAQRVLEPRGAAGDAAPGQAEGHEPPTPHHEPAAGRRAGEVIEDSMRFVGLVGMIDPPRESVREAVQRCAKAHVRAVMITGDHKLTAIAVAKEIGLWQDGSIALTGAELEKLAPEEIDARIDRAQVFARVSAEQKLRIIEAFKRAGHVVAMTGDGVNDAPALREAHIGVAMGQSGTDVAREAADMIIADDDFATIVDAVSEGRAIWRNIQKFVFFLLSSNAGLLVAVFAASFFTSLDPLTPLMILWINLVTNGLPALALGVDPPDPRQMREPPRAPSGGLLEVRDWVSMAFAGGWMGAAAMVCYLLPPEPHPSAAAAHARAMAFSLLALSPLFHAFNCRSRAASVLSLRPLVSLPLAVTAIASACIHLVAVLIPGLRPVFQTYPMDAREWIFLLLLSASIVPAVEGAKLARRRLDARRSPRAPSVDRGVL